MVEKYKLTLQNLLASSGLEGMLFAYVLTEDVFAMPVGFAVGIIFGFAFTILFAEIATEKKSSIMDCPCGKEHREDRR
jgi:hypothetical protein